MSRRLARETAMQVLFQLDVLKEKPDLRATVQRWGDEFTVPQTSINFAQELVEGTVNHLEEIDQKISSISEGWSLNRMGKVDLSLLRLATYEILFRSDIPGRVTLNEAIEIAKRFAGDESGKFINGILNRLVENADKTEGVVKTESSD